MSYEKLLAVVAGPGANVSELYQDRLEALGKTVDTLMEKYFPGIAPMVISGNDHELMSAGLIVSEAIHLPSIIWFNSGFLNDGMFNARKLDNYLETVIPANIRGLILVAASSNSREVGKIKALGNRRGPLRNLRPGAAWVSNPAGREHTIYKRIIENG